MKRSIWLGASLMVVLAAAWFATAADAPASKAKDDGGDKKEANRVKYARMYLDLTKLDLQMAKDRNKAFPETLPPGIMLVMEENVALADLWLKQEQAEADGKLLTDLAVKMAEIRLKAAEISYKQLQEANRLSPQSPQKLERLRLKYELAKLNVGSAKDLKDSSPVDLVQFELERLREEVADLYVHQLRLLDRN